MTNKLPVVGKTYKCTQRGLWWHKESLVCGVYQNKVWIDMCYGNNQEIISLEAFFRSHEEFPKDKAETKPTIKENLQVGLNNEVKEAVWQLYSELSNESECHFNKKDALERKSHVLLRAIIAASEIAGQIEEIENNNNTLNKIIAIIEQKDLNEIKEFCRRNGFDHPLLDFASEDDIIEKIKEQNEDVITKIYNTINV